MTIEYSFLSVSLAFVAIAVAFLIGSVWCRRQEGDLTEDDLERYRQIFLRLDCHGFDAPELEPEEYLLIQRVNKKREEDAAKAKKAAEEDDLRRYNHILATFDKPGFSCGSEDKLLVQRVAKKKAEKEAKAEKKAEQEAKAKNGSSIRSFIGKFINSFIPPPPKCHTNGRIASNSQNVNNENYGFYVPGCPDLQHGPRRSGPALDDLICPLSREFPSDPVTAEDGRIYDRSAIEAYFKSFAFSTERVKSPVTGMQIGKRLSPSLKTIYKIEALVENGTIAGALAKKWLDQASDESKDRLRFKEELRSGTLHPNHKRWSTEDDDFRSTPDFATRTLRPNHYDWLRADELLFGTRHPNYWSTEDDEFRSSQVKSPVTGEMIGKRLSPSPKTLSDKIENLVGDGTVKGTLVEKWRDQVSEESKDRIPRMGIRCSRTLYPNLPTPREHASFTDEIIGRNQKCGRDVHPSLYDKHSAFGNQKRGIVGRGAWDMHPSMYRNLKKKSALKVKTLEESVGSCLPPSSLSDESLLEVKARGVGTDGSAVAEESSATAVKEETFSWTQDDDNLEITLPLMGGMTAIDKNLVEVKFSTKSIEVQYGGETKLSLKLYAGIDTGAYAFTTWTVEEGGKELVIYLEKAEFGKVWPELQASSKKVATKIPWIVR